MIRRHNNTLNQTKLKNLFQALSPKLNEQERETLLKPLLEKKWVLDSGKDSISKEYTFKDFNQVRSLFLFGIL